MDDPKWFRRMKWILCGLSIVSIWLCFWKSQVSVDPLELKLFIRYTMIPFFLLLCVQLTVGGILLFQKRKPLDWTWRKRIINTTVSIIAMIMGPLLCIQSVILPLCEIPYLQNPQVLRLKEVTFDSVTFEVSGVDQKGNKHTYEYSPHLQPDTSKNEVILEMLPISKLVLYIK